LLQLVLCNYVFDRLVVVLVTCSLSLDLIFVLWLSWVFSYVGVLFLSLVWV
jgi:hypothetical protein